MIKVKVHESLLCDHISEVIYFPVHIVSFNMEGKSKNVQYTKSLVRAVFIGAFFICAHFQNYP